MKYSLIKPLNKEYSIIEQILTNRGISIDKIEKYLNTNEESVLHPLLLDNMIDGIQMLMKHIYKENARVFLKETKEAVDFFKKGCIISL